MANPVILVVDDEPAVLRAIERELRARFGTEYAVVAADSGPAALDVIRRLALRKTPLALMLVDQRMPSMTGIEFLASSIELAPGAGRVLLTAYADTEALPRTEWLAEILERDKAGFIVTGPALARASDGRVPGWSLAREPFLLETNVPGSSPPVTSAAAP